MPNAVASTHCYDNRFEGGLEPAGRSLTVVRTGLLKFNSGLGLPQGTPECSPLLSGSASNLASKTSRFLLLVGVAPKLGAHTRGTLGWQARGRRFESAMLHPRINLNS